MRKLIRSPYFWYIFALAVLNILPVLAPVFMKLSETPSLEFFKTPAKGIYFIYSFACHQFAHRSLHIYDYQCAWCARDMGIWGGILAVAIAVRNRDIKAIKWYWVIPFIVPMALDGVIQTVATILEVAPIGATGDPVYISNDLVRFITGSLFGIGVSLFISPRIRDMFENKDTETTRSWRPAMKIFAVMIIIYIGLVQIWSLTSQTNRPSDFLDTAVKTPAEDFYTRRANGICPTEGVDLFNLDCFLE